MTLLHIQRKHAKIQKPYHLYGSNCLFSFVRLCNMDVRPFPMILKLIVLEKKFVCSYFLCKWFHSSTAAVGLKDTMWTPGSSLTVIWISPFVSGSGFVINCLYFVSSRTSTTVSLVSAALRQIQITSTRPHSLETVTAAEGVFDC